MDDIFNQESKAEYLVCTKTSTSEKTNPIIGFSLYYEPTALISILANGNLISLGILTAEILPKMEESKGEEDKEEVGSPLKKMLREPFDSNIQKILMRSSNQPILKLGGEGKHSQKECYEVSRVESRRMHLLCGDFCSFSRGRRRCLGSTSRTTPAPEKKSRRE
jgi:hypothetical protein